LIAAYYDVVEKIKRKPTQEDINNKGEYKTSKYLSLFGSWTKFLKEIGEHTEASYHFPQGTHLGHILYILYTIGENKIENSHIRPEYVRFVGSYSADIGEFQRQTKYKLQALMEMKLLVDFRNNALEEDFKLKLTENGEQLYERLKPLLNRIDFSFNTSGKKGELTWMMNCESTINNSLLSFLNDNPEIKNTVRDIFLEMDALNLFLKYLYKSYEKIEFSKNEIYSDFFEAPFVKSYLDRKGIEKPSEEAAKRRIPFLINLLEAIGIIQQKRSVITLLGFYPNIHLFKSIIENSDIELNPDEITNKVNEFFNTGNYSFEPIEETILKEEFGRKFLTQNYYLEKI
jgi:hypothetical protein